ncbi:Gfo/Idh/MocA family protein [Chthonomonas calidirosea]|uniref:Gfo/Idh/MocA family protein n=1 Tax=Chthonomonas calidirosea TaxID=454171 RepID=UPI0006EC8CF4|nr:Gfo/Idh/MocA family oxidoreductase [Chthonomonas calidirosea]CEK17725.1 predicted dehydrogenase [Chthonomonas calidirosea]
MTVASEGVAAKKVVRMGVIGAGNFASRRHIPDILKCPEARLEALCRRDPEARARLAAFFHLPPERAYADWRQMLEEAPLDAVVIATPHALHYEQAKAALERGLHVLVEKPMAVRAVEAQELNALAEAKGLKLAVALNPPHWAHCHQIRRALHDERMGELEAASLFWCGSAEPLFGKAPLPENLPGVVPPSLFRADPNLTGGGYFIDGGSHLVSELLWTTGRRVKRVTAVADNYPSDMRISVSLELDNAAFANITTIGDSKFVNRRLRHIFACTGGTVTVNHWEFETSITLHEQQVRRFKEADMLPVEGPVANFVSAILGYGSLYSPGTHGADVVEVVEAVYRSLQTGKSITLPLTNAAEISG